MRSETLSKHMGTFSNCLKNCAIIKGKNLTELLLKNEPPEFSEGEKFGNFYTVSYYAKDVGLVKESQYNSKGEITCALELVEYSVKGIRKTTNKTAKLLTE